ncbi:hypothetical protein [Shimia sp.]|uniref:hypothetical protein n=1 Tax=Shimia sp. TaxID=1954381 RepID=UPI003B8E95AD
MRDVTSGPPNDLETLHRIGCDDFEVGLLPVFRHITLSILEADPKAWSRAYDLAVERYGEAIGLPAALGLHKIALCLLNCREDGPALQDPLCPEAKQFVTDDEVQVISMVHHMRRDNASAARSAVAFVTHGRMDPDLIRTALSFAHRFPAGVRRLSKSETRPRLSVVA